MNIEGHSHAHVSATPERCLAVLLDFASYPEWWPGCSAASVASGDPQTSCEVDMTFDTRSPIGEVEVRLAFTVSADRLHVTLHRVSGRITRLDGDGWTLTPAAGGTDVTYAVSGEMDTGLPGFLERPFESKAVELLIVRPVAAFAERVDAA